MNTRLLSLALLSGWFVLPLAAQAVEEPDPDDTPGRGVARISLIHGDVTVKRGDSGDTTGAAINAPLMVQDRVFTGSRSRAELQFDRSNMIRMAANSEVRIAEIEQRRYIVQLARGLVTFTVLREQNADVELSTPSISIRPLQRGAYRVEVHEDGTTELSVRSGEAEIYTPQGTEKIRAGRTVVARGTAANPEFRDGETIPEDDWDRWNVRRDRDLQKSTSVQHVSQDIYGAEDLDDHGSWVDVPQYGSVWTPRVAAGWAPYRDGRWVWADWYGWTWVSYDPWGWAPYHYGRWFNQPGFGWCWWPGGVGSRHFWRPALVGFFGWGGGGFGAGIGFGRVGWTPLAPYERFRPWYGSRQYGGYRNNSYIDNSVRITNNVNITNIYRNARVANGVSGMNGADFAGGRGHGVRSLGESDLRSASTINGRLPIVPERQSLRMADREVTQRGGGSSDNTRFVSRRQPSQVERASFDDQRRGMEQVTRRTFGNEGVRSIDTGRGATVGAPVAETGRRSSSDTSRPAADGGGMRRLGETSGSATQTGRSADNGGWRTFGGSGQSSDNGGVPSGETGRRSAPDTSGRTSDGGGWRRVGETSGSTTQSGRASDSRGVPSGETGRRSAPDTSGSRSDRGGWRSFGDASTPRSSGDTSSQLTNSGRSADNGGGWRRGDGSSRTTDSSGSVGNRGGARSYGGGDVQVSPPIVRDRGGDSGGWRNSDRGYQAPRSNEGGGGRSADFGGGGRSGGGGGRSADSGGGGRSGGGDHGGGRSGGGGGRQR